jgi:hypothetical protein
MKVIKTKKKTKYLPRQDFQKHLITRKISTNLTTNKAKIKFIEAKDQDLGLLLIVQETNTDLEEEGPPAPTQEGWTTEMHLIRDKITETVIEDMIEIPGRTGGNHTRREAETVTTGETTDMKEEIIEIEMGMKRYKWKEKAKESSNIGRPISSRKSHHHKYRSKKIKIWRSRFKSKKALLCLLELVEFIFLHSSFEKCLMN